MSYQLDAKSSLFPSFISDLMASSSSNKKSVAKHPDRAEAEAIVSQLVSETPDSVLKIVKELLCKDLVEKLAVKKEVIRKQREHLVDLEVRFEELEEAVHQAWEENDSIRRDLDMHPELV